jgi:rhodanese-related sulfurtransferase
VELVDLAQGNGDVQVRQHRTRDLAISTQAQALPMSILEARAFDRLRSVCYPSPVAFSRRAAAPFQLKSRVHRNVTHINDCIASAANTAGWLNRELKMKNIDSGAFRRAFIAATAVLGLGWASIAGAADTPPTLQGVKVITAQEGKRMLDKGVPFIDARVAAEYAEKTVKGAKNVPYREKSAKTVDFDRTQDQFDLARLPPDKAAPLVFFCNAGECWKSYKASVLARDAGYSQVHWLRGGMPEWTAKGLPTQ